MIDVMLSKATDGMLIAELLNRRNDKEVLLPFVYQHTDT